jgi:hypothetical protein
VIKEADLQDPRARLKKGSLGESRLAFESIVEEVRRFVAISPGIGGGSFKEMREGCSTGYSAQSLHRVTAIGATQLNRLEAMPRRFPNMSSYPWCKPATPLINVTMCAGLCLISPLLLASSGQSRLVRFALALPAVK